jgi:hypothetical protein
VSGLLLYHIFVSGFASFFQPSVFLHAPVLSNIVKLNESWISVRKTGTWKLMDFLVLVCRIKIVSIFYFLRPCFELIKYSIILLFKTKCSTDKTNVITNCRLLLGPRSSTQTSIVMAVYVSTFSRNSGAQH